MLVRSEKVSKPDDSFRTELVRYVVKAQTAWRDAHPTRGENRTPAARSLRAWVVI